ncbi:sensor histidine kinase [Sphingomicrobium nitratireducens]|uniref:sensor histidine kinase n=1 Tax=Sphingomicrobium nitratireducens TaxID=2964666 RepID=UPI00223EACFC|nr:HAMP domain-containing sensor histidine kinase [Sphingomicrobium nitratireducens]
MVSDIVSERSEGLRLAWSGRWSLKRRILAVNVITLVTFALAILFLDSYRNRLREERVAQLAAQANAAAAAVTMSPDGAWPALLSAMAGPGGPRFRLYDADGTRLADSWSIAGPTYRLRDPTAQAFTKDIARALDRGFNWLTGDPVAEEFVEPLPDRLSAWPEGLEARTTSAPVTRVRDAPERTPVFSAAAPVAGEEMVLLATFNDRAFTRTLRSQRASIAAAMAIATLLSVLLSLFLARTIARPLRHIALAAQRVRLGRSREVNVPRLPSRRDEIGTLARAVSDMSQSLRNRIDQIEAFAADVTHELKNPLASLRSAVDGLERIEDPALRRQLLDVVQQDVLRLDRLIGDISEAARTDAELARAQFEPVDMGDLVGQLVGAWATRRETGNARLVYARPQKASVMVEGDPSRLARAVDNLIDNAISFSPPRGLVEVSAMRVGDKVRVQVRDEGPGVPAERRATIFNRFHSIRHGQEDFGQHSGLGLAIAKAIVDGHDGSIDVGDRPDGGTGACFTITLPALEKA